jgi:hypothetical protein
MVFQRCKGLLLFTGLILGAALPAQAAERAKCYRIPVRVNAAAEADIHAQTAPAEVWCYENMASPTGRLYIYNADLDVVRPELAMMVDNDGTLTHGSLSGGRTTYHKVNSKQFNPFSVPLSEPAGFAPAVNRESEVFAESAARVQNLLLSARGKVKANFKLRAGTFSSSASYLPWRGYWWPYKGAPLAGRSDSPLGKYDAYVAAQTGTSPGTRNWENGRHVYKGVWWEGHCNGWAASAILRRQPSYARRDGRSGIEFSASDQKGLLAESVYCPAAAYFGTRYYNSGNDLYDVNPADFHKALTYYIGSVGKPVAVDYRRDAVVDNNIISGYTMYSDGSGRVTAELTIHKYDGSITDEPGVAPAYRKTYEYQLSTDAAGNIVGGRWISENPDFLWVPLGNGVCPWNNQNIDPRTVDNILSLPAAF